MADASIFHRLKQDHDSHRQLFAKMADAQGEPDRLEKLFEQFKVEVKAHAAAEEETLYATMLARPDLREDAQHSVSEHKEIEDYLEEMEEQSFNGPEWRETFAQMKKRYLHHIEEEEEEMFPDAAKDLSAQEEEQLGARFAERKPAELERAQAEE
ncbi:hemerythrin domain-containing protein [Sphingobium naphthae]|jgi:hemerythrin superfamily protein|uniref:Hemerythrin domain-containing protein n=1 Tax=Sphingobium naphthae TaxID=1886786 RepID=A0ABU3ZYH5_9SPHN|nr:hemerythrin domain-containing protein [Sphingobium naphthae]MCC4253370.1 hemerythrin domain-containing protein [Sphingobium naphthae]MDV5824571.1 hemerythrin domain-containing protein [Sphingobium naphthae]MEC7932602.1 hemerythrin domain-containing protein [Pseudomonadota bacterium]MEC8035571.1 hemerythrin domain-containing protein [Pseudomonadota bacterium]